MNAGCIFSASFLSLLFFGNRLLLYCGLFPGCFLFSWFFLFRRSGFLFFFRFFSSSFQSFFVFFFLAFYCLYFFIEFFQSVSQLYYFSSYTLLSFVCFFHFNDLSAFGAGEVGQHRVFFGIFCFAILAIEESAFLKSC